MATSSSSVSPRARCSGLRHATGTPAALSRLSRSTRPSVEPSSAWLARSGWGISPTTLRPSLQMPGDVVDRAVGVVLVAEDDAVVVAELRRVVASQV